MQLKPGFGVVTFVLTTLVVAGFFSLWAKRFIPPGKENVLSQSTEPFLYQARYQPVNWRPTFDEAYRNAAETKRPIMLVIGSSQTTEAWYLDELVFSEPSLAALINKESVPVRVDALEHPEWANAFLPISRLQMPNFGPLQIWLLSAKGEILGFLPAPHDFMSSERDVFVSVFGDSLRRIRSSPNYADALAAKQRSDRAALNASRPGVSISTFAGDLHQLIDPEFGGIPVEMTQQLWPQVWEFFILLGKPQYSAYSLNAMILSPQFDLQNGGFFTETRDRERLKVVFNKGVVENAELLRSLSTAAAVLHDPLYQVAAKETLGWLLRSLSTTDDLPSWEISHTDIRGRSPSHSYSLANLYNELSGTERDYAKNVLNLEPRRNPAMVPYVRQRRELLSQQDEIQQLLTKLGQIHEPPKQVGAGLSVTKCRVIARCIEALRLEGDVASEAIVRGAFDQLGEFVRSDEVLRTTSANDRSASVLSWLAYSDAMLQMYLLDGDPQVLQAGSATLQRAIDLFKSASPGLLRFDRSRSLPLWLSGAPEIVDYNAESATAQAIRLFRDFAILTSGLPESERFRKELDEALSACASLARESNPALAGLFCARLIGLNQNYGFTVGKSAVRDAREAKQLRPLQLWFPAVGKVRPDLQKLAPGTYWVQAGATEGPLNRSQILRIVPDSLNPAPTGQKK